ncbi:MAG: hypothetical protein JF597_52680 [Streptomyces sp.]|uniref:hypothetical protein n=1 Tax=Streptomyces sp. TaxID=1931 RepID=UPI0025D9ACE0|nr:hypothetical protein [Streptomyces sp.]MBW8801887.1 hypothetical protein [Streptomyces sp.]
MGPDAADGTRRRDLGTATTTGATGPHGRTKHLLHLAAHSGLPDVLAAEADAQGTAARSPEHTEGLAAFTAKRAPRFATTGRLEQG